MKDFVMTTIAYKKFFSLLLSVVILANTFSFVSRQSTDLFDVEDVYTTSSISKYYNLLSLLPIKIVSEFLSIDLTVSNNIGTKQTSKSKQKNKSTKNTATTDFAFSMSNSSSLTCTYSKFLKHNLLAVINNLSINKSYFELVVFSLISSAIVVFNGCMILARGDIEDNIIINKIENKVVRLV